MKSLFLEGKRWDSDDINMVTIDGVCYSRKKKFFEPYIVIIAKDGNRWKLYKDYNFTVPQLRQTLQDWSVGFYKKDIDNFILLDNLYLLNMDNVRYLYLKSDMKRLYWIEAGFGDGSFVELYRGNDLKYATKLIETFEQKQREYFVDKLNNKGQLL